MYESYTPDTILAAIVSKLDTELLTNEGSFTRDMLEPMSYELWKLYLSLNALEPMFYIDETSGAYIDKMCKSFGLFRKAGTFASCAVTFTGTDGVIIPADAAYLTADGMVFTLQESVTITGGVGTGTLMASEAGERYNIGAGEILKAQTNISGVTGVSNAQATGGVDTETDAALCKRFYAFLRRPATSGNGFHYQQWAAEVAGVGASRVIGLWNGAGTVKVILASGDMEPVDAAVVAAAAAHIEAERPIGPSVTVVSAGAAAVAVSAAVSISDTVTAAGVQAEFAEELGQYLHELVESAFSKVLDATRDTLANYAYTVVYNRVVQLLMDCAGVLDFSSLTVNGGTANVSVAVDQVPVLGTVAVTETAT